MKGRHTNMVKTQYRRANSVKRVSIDYLKDRGDEEIVFIPRSTVTSRIVKLQNPAFYKKSNNIILKKLIDAFYNQDKENFSKQNFVQMDVKSVNECFKGTDIYIYIYD